MNIEYTRIYVKTLNLSLMLSHFLCVKANVRVKKHSLNSYTNKPKTEIQ